MDTSNLTAAVRDLFSLFAPFGGAALIAAVLWVIYRTGSGHVLRRRIWRLTHGKEDVQDPVVKAFADEQTSLMAFRFESGVRVRTIERARALARWLKDNDEDVAAVRRCGRYFDSEESRLKVRLPSKKLMPVLLLATTLLAMLALFPLRGAVDHRALLRITKSGTWFLISPKADQAMRLTLWPLWPHAGDPPKALLPDMCNGDLVVAAAPTQLSPQDAKVICDLFKDAKAPDVLARALTLQRIPLAAMALMLLAFAYAPLRRLKSIEAAHEMSERVKKQSPQAELNFDQ